AHAHRSPLPPLIIIPCPARLLVSTASAVPSRLAARCRLRMVWHWLTLLLRRSGRESQSTRRWNFPAAGNGRRDCASVTQRCALWRQSSLARVERKLGRCTKLFGATQPPATSSTGSDRTRQQAVVAISSSSSRPLLAMASARN